MHPILLTLGPLHFYSYGLCLALALGLSIFFFAKDASRNFSKKVGLAPETTFQKVFDLGVVIILSSLAGARTWYVVEFHHQYAGNWFSALKIWEGGLVFYGGLLGALVGAFFWLKSQKWPLAAFFDLVAPYILLGHAIGRMGCFLNGCCYGNLAEPHHGLLDWGHGWVFPGGEDQFPHLPTQLWEMTGDLSLFFFLLAVRRWTLPFPWMGFALYGLLYGTLRFFIEIHRHPPGSVFLGIFCSPSQALSAAMMVLGACVVVWALAVGNAKKHAVR